LLAKGKVVGKQDVAKSWSEITNELKINKESQLKKIGLKSSDLDMMKKNGLTEKQALQAGSIAFNFKKSVKDVIDKYKSGKTLDSIEKQYRDEEAKNKIISSSNNLNERIIKQYNITQDEIKKCRDAGINETVKIGYLKSVAKKYKVTFDEIITVYQDKKTLKGVNDELEAKE
jgi:hypothetical protein